MHSATCSIWSREMKLKVSGKTGAIQTIGWSSSKYRYDGSFEDMRRSLVRKLAPLPVNYGTPGRRPRDWKTWMNNLASGASKYGRRAVKALKVMKGALDRFDELQGQLSADRDAIRHMVKSIEKKINRSSLRSKEKEDIRKLIDVTEEELGMIDENIKKAGRFTEKVDDYVETNARSMRM